jgi:hypothetical protein
MLSGAVTIREAIVTAESKHPYGYDQTDVMASPTIGNPAETRDASTTNDLRFAKILLRSA